MVYQVEIFVPFPHHGYALKWRLFLGDILPPFYFFIHSLIHSSHASITAPILPPGPPSFLPLITIKGFFPQLHIHRVVRLAHPPPEFVPIAYFRLVPIFHPRAEVIRAHPAGINFAEQPDELLRLGLLHGGRVLWVVRRYRMEQCPGGATEEIYIRRTIGSRFVRCG